VLAVEAAGQKMQGIDPVTDPVALKKLRKTTGWKPVAEVDALPAFPGWKGIGTRIRDLLGTEKPAENTRLSIFTSLTQVDGRLFPPHASAWQAIRLRQKVDALIDELRRRSGGAPVAATANGGGPDHFGRGGGGGDADEADDEPPSFS
jgi:hypothetical protein